MPELLNQKYRDQLVTWIGKACHFRLLYKISRDGCSPTSFHQQCDDKGATVTVLYNTNNTIFGGYLSQSWDSDSGYIDDSEAFLFRLQHNRSFDPLKFPVKDKSKAGYGSSLCGPIFGDGYDIHTFTGTVTRSGNEFPLNGSVSSIGKSYNLNGQTVATITNSSLKVTDLEVYRIVEGEEEERPWREHPAWTTETMQELKDTLQVYEPRMETNVTAANILLIGQIGAGKSSFFNSVDSIFRGRVMNKACSGNSERSITTMYRRYELKDSSTKKFLNFRLCDTCGFQEGFAFDAQEFSFIVCGNLPDCYRFNPLVPFESDSAGYLKKPELKDKIHCVAFVIDSSTVDVMPDKVLKHMKDLQARMTHRGLPHVVLLTKIDKLSPEVDDDVTNTYTHTTVCEAVNKAAKIMGLPSAHIFPIKNYVSEPNLTTALDILIMKALKRCLEFADDFMDEQLLRKAAEEKMNCTEVENDQNHIEKKIENMIN
ncbi:interferon-induced protein 44 [Magallana gigas]|uniref:interferon-induced protein 44 n=1 Tax=Magallana gigas TaxID=29159 RepID=UPI003341EF67